MEAEELKQQFISNLRKHIPEPLMPFFIEGLQLYADEQSRNKAVDFLLWNDDPYHVDEEVEQHYYAIYDNWLLTNKDTTKR